jgi:hypothetical protein
MPLQYGRTHGRTVSGSASCNRQPGGRWQASPLVRQRQGLILSTCWVTQNGGEGGHAGVSMLCAEQRAACT